MESFWTDEEKVQKHFFIMFYNIITVFSVTLNQDKNK